MTAVAVGSRRPVHVAVHRGAALAVGTGDEPVALAGREGIEQALALADQAPRAIALQARERFGMAFRGQQLFTAIGAVAGRRGATGPSGSALPAISFGYGDASPRLIHVFDEPALLAELQLVVQEPFDGEGAELLLRTQSGQVLLDSDQNAPGLVATFETTPAAQLPAGTAIYLDITPGLGATTGAGQVLLNLH